MSVLTEPMVKISPDNCKSCGLCIASCPKNVLEFSTEFNKMGFHPARYKGEGCIGCGFCFYVCPEPFAITVYKKGYDLKED